MATSSAEYFLHYKILLFCLAWTCMVRQLENFFIPTPHSEKIIQRQRALPLLKTVILQDLNYYYNYNQWIVRIWTRVLKTNTFC